MAQGTIENVGPIQHLDFPIPESGGVVIFKGVNGSGKSSALEAIDAAATGNGKHALSARDGTKRGQVEAFGVRLTIGKSTRRSGEADVLTLEGRYSLAELVDPGIKDAEAADARRLKSLVQLAKVQPDAAIFAELVGGMDNLQSVARPETLAADDILTMAARLKADLEAKARAFEGSVTKLSATAQASRSAAAGVDVEAECDGATLQAALESAVRLDSETKQRQKVAIETHEARRVVRQQFEAANSYDGPTLADTQVREQSAERDAGMAQHRVEEARKALQEAEQQFALARNDYSAAITARKQAEQHERMVAAWKEQLDAPLPELVTVAELSQAATAVQQARQAVENGALIRKAREQLETASEADAARKAAEKAAERYRDLARGTDDVLSEIVGRLNCPLRVDAGRLVLDTGRGVTYFAELSEGERWRLALDIGIAAVGRGGELTIGQAAWEALDPANRQAIANQAAEAGVVIYTAEATDGELRAELYGRNGG